MPIPHSLFPPKNAHFVHLKSGLCLDEPVLDPSFVDDAEDLTADGHIQNRAKLPTMGRCERSKYSQVNRGEGIFVFGIFFLTEMGNPTNPVAAEEHTKSLICS